MKFKILIFLTLIITGIVGFYAYNASEKSKLLYSPISDNTGKKTQTDISVKKQAVSQKTKLYQDPSGFTFSYPDDLKISTIDKNDPDYYSSLKLKNDTTGESMTIDVTSTKYATLEEWVKNNQQLTNKAQDLKIGGLKAKRISSPGKIMLVAVDVETLITMTANFTEENQEYWKNSTAKIASTFAFALPENATNSQLPEESSVSSEEDVVFEGEEVLE